MDGSTARSASTSVLEQARSPSPLRARTGPWCQEHVQTELEAPGRGYPTSFHDRRKDGSIGYNETGETMTQSVVFNVVQLGEFPATRSKARDGRNLLEEIL